VQPFGRMQVRLTIFVLATVLLVSIPVVYFFSTASFDAIKANEYSRLEKLISSVVSDESYIKSVSDEQLSHMFRSVLGHYPGVSSIELLSEQSIKQLSKEKKGYIFRLFDGEDNNWIKVQFDEKYFDAQFQQILERFLLVVLILVVVTLVMMWLIFGKLVAFVNATSHFLNKLNISDHHQNFENVSPVNELEVLRQSVNVVADRFYMQSVALRKSFDEISRLSLIFEHSPSLIVTIDQNHSVRYLNKAFKDQLLEKFDNDDVFELMPEEIGELVNKAILDNQTIQGVETKHRGHSYIWSVIPMPSQTIVNCYGVDITEVRAAESETETAYMDSLIAKDESEAKSIFLANMSHEVRTPLTAILGFSESLLESGQSMKDRVVAINTVIRNAQHLLHIINDLLDITKIEAGQAVVQLEKTSLVKVIQDVQNNFEPMAKTKRLDFNLNISYPLPEYVISDEVRLKQVLFNVCTNAIKFTERGEVSVDIGFNADVGELRFVISDTGVGITKDEMNFIFHRFEQIDKSHTRKYGGVGVGLYITHELVERLGGSIEVNSEVGKGSQFSLVVKAEAARDTAFVDGINFDVPEVDQDFYQSTKFSGQILLVEDNVDNQNLIHMYLTKMGAKVSVASNGVEAVDLAASQVFDLILMDMQMPEMDGVEATKKIRSSGNEQPIVMLTANVLKEDMDLCFEAGCDDFLTKPIEKESFSAFVSHYLSVVEPLNGTSDPIVSVLVDEGPEFYKIVKAYVKQLSGDLDNVVQVFKSGNMNELKRKIHSMKGTSGNMGFLEYSALCSQVEFAITKEDNEEIDALLSSLNAMKKRIVAGVPVEELQ